MGAHRYWRFRNSTGSNNANYISCTALRFYPNVLSGNVAKGLTGISSGILAAGYEAANAFDDNVGTEYFSNGGANGYIGIDFGAGNAYPLDHFGFQIETASFASGPKDIQVEWSDNGTAWTLEWAITGLTWSAGESKGFTNPTRPAFNPPPSPHRYWRLLCHANGGGGGWFAVGELQGQTALVGSNVLTGGTASASGTYSTSSPAYAFNGVLDAGWVRDSNTDGEWLKYDLGAGNAKAITQLVMYSRSDGFASQSPVSWEWQYSDDDVTYTTLFGTTWPAFTTASQAQSYPNVSLAALRRRRIIMT